MTYLLVGTLSAGLTVGLFPPQPGYRPPILVWAVAVSTFVLLWPFLWLMGCGYVIGCIYRWHYDRRQAMPSAPLPQAVRVRRPTRFVYRSLYEETPN